MAKENYAGVAPCPGCGAQEATKVGFVWWGGVLAAKLMSLAKCSKCGATYNGKTGKDQSKAWIYYFLLPLVFLATAITIIRLVGVL